MGVGKGRGRFQAASLGLVCLLLVLGRSTPVESFDLFNSIFGGIDPIDEDGDDLHESHGEGFKKELSASAAGAGSASLSLDKAKGIGAGGSLSGAVSFGKDEGETHEPEEPRPMAPPPPMHEHGYHHQQPPPNNYVREPQPGWVPPPPPQQLIYAHPNSVRNQPPPGHFRAPPPAHFNGPPPPPRFNGPPPPPQHYGPPRPQGQYNGPPPDHNQHYRNIAEEKPLFKPEDCKNIKNTVEREKCILIVEKLLHNNQAL